ncbi:unnamed protein product [Vitrella brassicaformis CCMP3155]|uniref:Uncharacterized protein n=1 Tax=Vitrella brassicaformis (strain CCMP3155) TaxID=1169540 RepID=A0A0G4FSV5_VITBC|nr:unnamed protein product [Vitrella brassicaformis CCMP3155]|eukprot:CEM17751.1 unnamed protein product [Vitrella brassicaformis CCMP3155]
MNVSQLKEQAAGVEQGLDQLLQLQSEVGACLSQIKQVDPANHPAEESSPESLQVHVQLSLAAAHVDSAVTQLSSVKSGLSGAVDALTATATPPAATSSAAANADGQSQARRPSYRLIHQSGNPPPVNKEGPARLRLSRDELASVFGHLQPWELTRHRRRLGTPLFHQSAANYTHLVIDCEDETARHMWETMPLDVAHKWGQRATNVREIKHRYPKWQESWCRGTWVAVVEGHARGRAAIARKKRREREGGEGTAAAAPGQGDQPADEGTLEVLSFEAVELDDSIDIPNPPPSSDLLPAPAAPIHLSALTTVDNIPREFLRARVGRQWRTPAVKSLITRDMASDLRSRVVSGLRAWLAEAIEELDLKGWDADMTADGLSVLPADGKSLAALRTLRGVRMDWSRPADIDRLREVMVARGVSRSIRELEIDMGWRMPSTNEYWERLQRVARLIDAIAHPEAVKKGVFALSNDGTCGQISAELLSRSSTGPAAAQKLINEYAKVAHTVVYSGGDEAVPAAITDDSFPAASTLLLFGGALANEAKKKRSVEIASHMPSLSCIETRGAPASALHDEFETFYSNVIATITSFNDELKGHKKTCVRVLNDALRTDFERRFMAQHAGISLLNGGPYKLSLDGDKLYVERRDIGI